MNIKKIESLLHQIENATIVQVDDSPYLHSVDIAAMDGDPDNQVARFSWHDAEGLEFSIIINELGLSDAEVLNDCIICRDHKEIKVTIVLFDIVPFVIVKNW